MIVVVADTSPVNYLTLIGHADLLGALFGRVFVPAAVATGALLVIAVQEYRSAPMAPPEQSRAIAGDAHLRVTAATAVVRGQPSGQGEVIATVRRGAALAVTGQEHSWYRVVLPDKRSGWIAREAFE